MNIFSETFDFFLPRFCVSCNSPLKNKEKVLCENCFYELESPTDEFINAEFDRKFLEEKIISKFFAGFIFENNNTIYDLIHSLKYSKRFKNGIFLGELIGKMLMDKNIFENVDLIIPVPLHPLKKAERGFNQSFYISKGIAKSLSIPVSNKILIRRRFTKSQTKLNANARRENISNAFALKHSKFVSNKNIILVDDVITTGSTISECGRELKNAGAKNIFAVSAAIADY